MITDSEMKPTRNGDGRYLQLTFQILEGPYKNRFVWARLNLHNANETAVKSPGPNCRRSAGRSA